MRRMTSVLQLGVGVVLLFTVVVVVPAASQQWCHWKLHDNYGCLTYTVDSRDAGKCIFWHNYFTDLYLRPSPTFTNLEIKITWPQGSPTILNIGRNEFKQPNMWYHVQMMSDPNFGGLYKVYIDGQQWGSVHNTYRANTFDVYVTGSLHYAVNCNPSHYPPPTRPPIQPPLTRLPPSEPEPSPPTAPPVKSTDDDINPPTTVRVSPQVHSTSASSSENIHDVDDCTTPEDCRKTHKVIEDAQTSLVLVNTKHIVVTVGAIIAAAFVTIMIAGLVIKKMKGNKDTDLHDPISGSIPMSLKDSRNNDEQNHDHPEDHIYEDMNDLRPVAGAGRPFSTGEEGVDESVGGGWDARRGSAHDSENSIYVPFS
ncbi:uncharacterized protein [Procambarus clarkii]|uniref:uncharacterized protein n=1 Tax=Procambarus clarkii TaxID=6728 RepID=UPI003743E7A7